MNIYKEDDTVVLIRERFYDPPHNRESITPLYSIGAIRKPVSGNPNHKEPWYIIKFLNLSHDVLMPESYLQASQEYLTNLSKAKTFEQGINNNNGSQQ